MRLVGPVFDAASVAGVLEFGVGFSCVVGCPRSFCAGKYISVCVAWVLRVVVVVVVYSIPECCHVIDR